MTDNIMTTEQLRFALTDCRADLMRAVKMMDRGDDLQAVCEKAAFALAKGNARVNRFIEQEERRDR